ncbi:MAG TPA: redoxin domain-containing protein [Blastocatellia bacterium]|nr:redoxin domain-containing protein [Blastocatellia bacterium]
MKTASKLKLTYLLLVLALLPSARAQGGVQKPRDPRAKQLEEKANLLLERRKSDEAIAALEEAIEIEPEWDSLHLGLGVAYSNKFLLTRNKAYEEKSLAAFRKCLELNPARAGVYIARARMAFAGRRYEDAIALAAREIAISPSEAFAYRLKWEAMLRRDDYEREVPVIRSEIEALLKSDVGREGALRAALFGYGLLADRDLQKSTEDLYVKEFPRSDVARNILRNRAVEESDKKKQIDLIEDFIARFPDDPNLAYLYPLLFRGLANRPDESGERIARVGEACIKSVTAPYDLIASRWAVAVALAERRFDLDRAQSIIDEAVKITDGLNTKSPLLGEVRQDERGGLIATLKTRAHMGRGFVLLRRGKIEEAARELGDNLQPVIAQVEKNGYILWKDMDLREIGVRPSVLWFAELFEAQGQYERAARYLLAGFGEDERANGYIRERLPLVYGKLGRDASAAASALSEAERRFNSLAAASRAPKEELKNRALAARVAKPAPDFKVLTLDKKLIRLSDLRGKVTVLNFWATWCGPCVAEMPHLQRAAEKYKDNPKVIILIVSTDENKLAVRSFLERNRYTMLAAYDDGAAERFGVRGIPATFIIDPGGVIQFSEEGFGAGGSDYVDRMTWRVDELLKDKAAPAAQNRTEESL